MNKIDLISIPAYEFFADDSLVDEVLDEIKKLKFDANTKNFISNENFYHKKLFDWFDSCLLKVKNIYFSDQLEFKITACWVNRTNMFQEHSYHGHINSIVSGSFYLEDSKTRMEVFLDDPWLKLQNENILGIGKTQGKYMPKEMITSFVTPAKGKLILFPSSLYHRVELHRERQPRYSIAFNSFLVGKFNPDSQTALLSLGISDPAK